MPKLLSNIKWLPFLGHSVYNIQKRSKEQQAKNKQ